MLVKEICKFPKIGLINKSLISNWSKGLEYILKLKIIRYLNIYINYFIIIHWKYYKNRNIKYNFSLLVLIN